jgi:chromate transport protein ChrA
MLLPGPEAQQLAIYIGWLLHRTAGGLVAGTLFVLPGAVALMALSLVYAAFGNVAIVQALFFGLKAAVLAIVLEAVVRIGRRALKNRMMLGLAAAAFVGIFFFDVPFPLIVFMAGLIGFIGGRAGLPQFGIGSSHGPTMARGLTDAESALGAAMPAHAQPSLGWSLRIGTICLVLWLGPVAALLLTLGPADVFSQIAVFFSKMAVVTFGGAYAVLAYVAQAAVETYGWLRPGEMLDGLGMAETTPGPLIMVVGCIPARPRDRRRPPPPAAWCRSPARPASKARCRGCSGSSPSPAAPARGSDASAAPGNGRWHWPAPDCRRTHLPADQGLTPPGRGRLRTVSRVPAVPCALQRRNALPRHGNMSRDAFRTVAVEKELVQRIRELRPEYNLTRWISQQLRKEIARAEQEDAELQKQFQAA